MRTCAPFSVQQRHGPYRACRHGNRFYPHQRCSLTITEPITSRWGIPYHTLSLIIPLGALQNNNQHCEAVRWCTPMWQLTGGRIKCQIYVQEDYVSHYSTWDIEWYTFNIWSLEWNTLVEASWVCEWWDAHNSTWMSMWFIWQYWTTWKHPPYGCCTTWTDALMLK
jgi:hypothetical protein